MLVRSALADDRRSEVRYGVEQALEASGAGGQRGQVALQGFREGIVQAPEGARRDTF